MRKNLYRVLLLVLVILPMFLLTSCFGPNKDPEGPNKDPEKAAEALEDKDYAVTLIDDEDKLKYTGIDGLKAFLTAINEEEELIMIYYFESSKVAREAWEEYKDEFEELTEDYEDHYDVEIVMKRSGKIIYGGTKQAIKDAR